MQTLKKGFNGYQLKIIALILMTFDHAYQGFYGVIETPQWFNILGRLVAPIFLFMLAEGMHYTHDRIKYMSRLYIASVLMSITNIIINKYTPQPGGFLVHNNIFATMFLITFFIHTGSKIREHIKSKNYKRSVLYLVLLLIPCITQVFLESFTNLVAKKFITTVIPVPFDVEGGIFAILLGIGFYLFRETKLKTSIFYIFYVSGFFSIGALFDPNWSILSIFEGVQWYMIFALVFISMYNNQKGKGGKYLFYIYYPLHIYVLTWLGIAVNYFK
ncbi:TraX family protein [Clostridiisalibacter paucivorans]|uniref:TraX family protein n=1 Tax=Clostridiisalibacter paucivorans TaxID=408753 RepID=UPI00047E2091|nr:TraX family protein [Clostridiisalibacter paucivorans]